MSEAYRVLEEVRFATGNVLRVGDLFRDNDNGRIQDTYRVDSIRNYRRSGLHVVLTIIRRKYYGLSQTPPTAKVVWPVEALFDMDDRIVRVTEDGAR